MYASAASSAVAGAATKTLLAVHGIADRRPKLKQIIIAGVGTMSDAVAVFALRRITATGTATSLTPRALNPEDGATPSCTAGENYTVEPTYATGNLAIIPLHLRGTAVWEPPAGVVVTCAIGTANGLGLQQISSGTENVRCTFIWEE
jgi:hypothetical protein